MVSSQCCMVSLPMRRASSWYQGTAEYRKACAMVRFWFHSLMGRTTPSQGITMLVSLARPVCNPMRALTILNVEAGRKAVSRKRVRL